jgi:hypothetical protein
MADDSCGNQSDGEGVPQMKPPPQTHPWRVRNRQQSHSAKVKRNLGLVPVVHIISPAEIVPVTAKPLAGAVAKMQG